ncbi:sugar phosphate isomerase/epimerase, partial [bacterium]|nr:sugar phosphate isomerase/epimerase [bacterium]
VLAALGARWMNVHPDRQAPFHSRATVVELNLRTIREVARFATDLGLGLMVENVPGWFNSGREMGELLNAVEGLGFHLDIGHANLQNDYNTTAEMLEAFGRRLRHVHLHDNKGGAHDLHLPLGAGNLDAPGCIRMLQDHGYDGTITLEVFTTDKLLLAYSRKVLKDLWDKCRELEKV